MASVNPAQIICLPVLTESAHTELQIIKRSRTIEHCLSTYQGQALCETQLSHFLTLSSQPSHEISTLVMSISQRKPAWKR